MEQPNQGPVAVADNHNENNDSSALGLLTLASATTGALYYGSSLAHEYGHKIVGEVLLGNKGTVHIGIAPYVKWESPIDINNWRALAMILGGPVTGIAAIFGFLKISNIIDEYCSGKSLINSIKNGIKKPFFHQGIHKDQMLITRGIAAAVIGANLYHLHPHKEGAVSSDGYYALESIKLLLNKNGKK